DYLNDPDAWYQLTAKKAAEGDHCIVYLDESQDIDQTTIDQLATEFDDNIHETVSTYFSSPTDIDNNQKVILLLLDIKDGYTGEAGSTYIGGYFFSIDLYTNDDLAAFNYPSYLRSNEGEILYIDVNPADPTSIDTRSTIAHEFQHLVNFSRNYIAENGDFMPTWMDEGLSMAAEALYQNVDILTAREKWYDMDPLYSGESGVTKNPYRSIAYGYPLTVWNPFEDSTAVLNNYALSHLFFAWLGIQMKNDGHTNQFLKNIIDDTDNTFQAVLNECGGLGDGTQVDTAPEMLQYFYMANLLGGNDNETGLASYLGKNQHTGPFTFESPAESISLYPGGAAHFSYTELNSWTPDSTGDPDIVYALGNISSYSSDFAAPYGTGSNGETLIVLNGDAFTETNTAKTSAPLPSALSPAPSFRSSGIPAYTALGRKSVQNAPLPQEAFRTDSAMTHRIESIKSRDRN
ncbi:MAG: hypothetical protein ACOCWH_02255, partial [Spirochaetota bacterium]